MAESRGGGSAQEPDWDAGATGCGELVIELKLRFMDLPPRTRFHLVASDPGAPEDLPAWSRLTGHRLVSAAHPHYVFETRG